MKLKNLINNNVYSLRNIMAKSYRVDFLCCSLVCVRTSTDYMNYT